MYEAFANGDRKRKVPCEENEIQFRSGKGHLNQNSPEASVLHQTRGLESAWGLSRLLSLHRACIPPAGLGATGDLLSSLEERALASGVLPDLAPVRLQPLQISNPLARPLPMLCLLSGKFPEATLSHLPGRSGFLHRSSYSPGLFLCGGAGFTSCHSSSTEPSPYTVLYPAPRDRRASSGR